MFIGKGHLSLMWCGLFVVVLVSAGPPSVEAESSLARARIQLRSGKATQRVSALNTLAAMGPKALPVASAIIGLLHDPIFQVRKAARRALVAIGAPVVPMLVKRLRAGSQIRQLRLVRVLHKLKAHLPAHGWSLFLQMESSSRLIRAHLAQLLIQSGPKVLPAVQRGLSHRAAVLRAIAAEILAKFKAKASASVPSLLQRLRDPVADVRYAVMEALGDIGPASAVAVPLLIKQYKQDPRSRTSVTYALCGIGEQAAPALSILKQALQQGSALMKLNATCALGAMKAKAAPATSALLQAAQQAAPTLQKRIFLAIEAIGVKQVPQAALVKAITPHLGGPKPALHTIALRLLKALGARALPALKQALRSNDWSQKLGAAQGIIRLGPKGLSVLCEVLKRGDWKAHYSVLSVMGQVPIKALPCHGLLVGLSRSREWKVRWALVGPLRRIEQLPQRMLLLQRLRQDAVWQVQFQAAAALVARGRREASLLPPLLKGLQARQPSARLDAAKALGTLGQQSLPALRKQLFHQVPQLRHAAAYALYHVKSRVLAPALPDVIKAIRDQNKGVRLVATHTLQQMLLRDAFAASRGLFLGLAHRDAFVRQTCIKLLKGMGKRIEPYVLIQLRAPRVATKLKMLKSLSSVGLWLSGLRKEIEGLAKGKGAGSSNTLRRAAKEWLQRKSVTGKP